jgi:hypothetical protein
VPIRMAVAMKLGRVSDCRGGGSSSPPESPAASGAFKCGALRAGHSANARLCLGRPGRSRSGLARSEKSRQTGSTCRARRAC